MNDNPAGFGSTQCNSTSPNLKIQAVSSFLSLSLPLSALESIVLSVCPRLSFSRSFLRVWGSSRVRASSTVGRPPWTLSILPCLNPQLHPSLCILRPPSLKRLVEVGTAACLLPYCLIVGREKGLPADRSSSSFLLIACAPTRPNPTYSIPPSESHQQPDPRSQHGSRQAQDTLMPLIRFGSEHLNGGTAFTSRRRGALTNCAEARGPPHEFLCPSYLTRNIFLSGCQLPS